MIKPFTIFYTAAILAIIVSTALFTSCKTTRSENTVVGVYLKDRTTKYDNQKFFDSVTIEATDNGFTLNSSIRFGNSYEKQSFAAQYEENTGRFTGQRLELAIGNVALDPSHQVLNFGRKGVYQKAK